MTKIEKVTQLIQQSNKRGEVIMRKLVTVIVVTIFFSGLASAADFIVELKAHYFSPSEEAFRDIYGGGIMYGGEASIAVWKEVEVWFGVSFFSKKGELAFTKEETKVKIAPLGAGVRYSYPVNEKISIYGGLGINYYSYKEENPLGEVSKGGLGPVVKAGGLMKVTKEFIVDVYVDYSYCKMKPADFNINVGGIEAGIGLGYRF
jgi:opacity protein-like surface antigen